eukprot:4904863-Amphidinium_carterae.1
MNPTNRCCAHGILPQHMVPCIFNAILAGIASMGFICGWKSYLEVGMQHDAASAVERFSY